MAPRRDIRGPTPSLGSPADHRGHSVELAAEGLQSNRLGEWHLSFRDCVWSLPSCAACVTHLRMRHTGHWGGGRPIRERTTPVLPPHEGQLAVCPRLRCAHAWGRGRGLRERAGARRKGRLALRPPGPAEVLPALQGAGAVGGHAGGSVMLPALWEHGPHTRAGLPLSLRDPDSTLSGERRLQKPVAPAASSAASFHH